MYEIKRQVHKDDPAAAMKIVDFLQEVVAGRTAGRSVVLLCIGSDRSTGDCLGPLVGMFLSERRVRNVYGTLDSPVHAGNLTETLDRVRAEHTDPFIVAVDACLGPSTGVGQLNVTNGPLQPGAMNQKELPAVGDVGFSGVVNVNVGGFLEKMFVLRNTRLGYVMALARVIAEGLCLWLQSLTQEVDAEGKPLRRGPVCPCA